MYVIHATRIKNLINILKNGYINNKPIGDTMLDKQDHPEQVFTQLTFREIPMEQKLYPFFTLGGCCIVLNPDILRELPFYATRFGRFRQRFCDGLTDPESIMVGQGHLDRVPDMTPLKKDIIRRVDAAPKWVGVDKFATSHEILFGRRIYLERFCKCILVYRRGPETKQIRELCKKRGIPFKILQRIKGIEQFIDLIES